MGISFATRSFIKLKNTKLYSLSGCKASSFITPSEKIKSSYDVIIIGGGHNGLVAGAYLSKSGLSVVVLEKRHVVGGAAVTEEIVPGFKFSRASYVLSLLQPHIISDLKLKEHGLKYYFREPYSSFTPISDALMSTNKFPQNHLLLSSNLKLSQEQISKFSPKDALKYELYEKEMGRYVEAITHLLNQRPPNLNQKFSFKNIGDLRPSWRALRALGKNIADFHYLLSAPPSKILDSWFESEPLKATLVTDALIGTMNGPHCPGTGYVLLHHIMGGIDGKVGAWVYPEGGMGAVSESIAKSAASLGAQIFTNMEVSDVLLEKNGSNLKAKGVVTSSGVEIKANLAVLSGATPHVTFNKILKVGKNKEVKDFLGPEFIHGINSIDYTSPVTKINVAVSKLPNFSACPNPSTSPSTPQPLHASTIHLGSETMSQIHSAFTQCNSTSIPSSHPFIEMTIPSSLDPTLCPPGSHVVLLFTQYSPYEPKDGSWRDESYKNSYCDKVIEMVDEYAPGFKESVVGREILSPVDLEETFGLTGGNIFHGTMSLDQLFWLRPFGTKKCWFPSTPIQNFILCGSGAHPGGGVMGTPGYLAAKTLLDSQK